MSTSVADDFGGTFYTEAASTSLSGQLEMWRDTESNARFSDEEKEMHLQWNLDEISFLISVDRVSVEEAKDALATIHEDTPKRRELARLLRERIAAQS